MRKKSRYKASSRIARRGEVRKILSTSLRVGIPLFLLIGLISLLRADFFQIKGVNVIGNNGVGTEEVANAILASMEGEYFYMIPRTNFLLLNEDDIKEKILENFPRVEDAEISHDLEGTISVEIMERKGNYLWCQSECYLMNDEGLIFAVAGEGDMEGKLVFKGNVEGDPILKKFASAEKMRDYFEVIELLTSASRVVGTIIVEASNKSIIRTDMGDIFLNPEEDMSNALPNALLLINEIQTNSPEARFEYIDARFGTKLFYRLTK